MSEIARATQPKRVIPSPAAKPCACGTPGHSGECDDCRDRVLQRAAAGPAPASVPASVRRTVGSAGRPLDSGTRAAMEARFGRDFGAVRVHTDHGAAESARAVNARAYTVGQHIAFDRDQYRPHSPAGQHLLAHELAHTVQQRGLQRKPNEAAAFDRAAEGRYEREADAAASRVGFGGRPSISHEAPGGLIQRTEWGTCPVPPTVRQLDARDEMINSSAELKMLEYYKQGRNPETIISNQNPLEGYSTGDPDLQRLAGVLREEFFTRYVPARYRRRELTGRPDEYRAPARRGSPESAEQTGPPDYGPVEGQRAERAPAQPALKRPDILDLSSGEVYDVTTIGQAGGKVSKIEISYVSQLNKILAEAGISSPTFSAGTKLKPPPPEILFYRYQRNRVICYGPTNLDDSPGVIAYVALEDAAGGEAEQAAGEPYTFTYGGTKLTVSAGPPGTSTDLRNSGPENLAASGAINGVIFTVLHRGKSKAKADTIDALIETRSAPKKGKASKQPIVITGTSVVQLTVSKTDGKVTKTTEKCHIPYQLEGLSEGTITKLDLAADGLRGEGILRPSIPLLRGHPLAIAFGPDEFRVISTINQDKLKVPIPGLRVTQASIELLIAPEFRPSGTLGFAVGPRGRPFLDGTLTIGADGEGFFARAEGVRAHIPGVDEATGTVEYRPATGWSGAIEIKTSQIPYVDQADVTVRLSDHGLLGEGGLTIKLPGNQVVRVTVSAHPEHWIYTGKADLTIPGLKTVSLTFTYDGKRINARGTTRIDVKGFTGILDVQYHNGTVSGEGTISGKKGRANLEHAKVKYNGRTGKFSGEGLLSYQVSENLIASAGVEIPEVGPVKVKGALTFPKPIKLFDPFGDHITVFTLPEIKIPIPGASIGPVGLVVTIEGGITADYRIGPGQLQDTKITADFQPFEESKDLKVDLQSRLAIPAHAGISGRVRAALAIDAVVASVSGGITVIASANLDGGLFIAFVAHYEKDRFTAQAMPEITATLVLALNLDADLTAKAGIGWFSVKTTKVWHLKQFRYNTGLTFGMKAPISYDSAANPSFTPPSMEKIQWIRPQLDPSDMLRSLFSGSGTESEGG